MIETEIKLRLGDAAEFRRLLAERGWTETARVFERNTVFDTPDGALRRSGRLLRLRRIDERGVVTVKLPSASEGPHKVREEHEFETDSPAQAEQVFEGIGYRAAWIYEKRRWKFRKDGQAGIVEVDETPIGSFCELEGPADWIDATAAELGFTASDYLIGSYRDLFDQWLAETGSNVEHMTFD